MTSDLPPIHEDFMDLREELRGLEHNFHWYGLRQLDYTQPCACKTLPDEQKLKCVRCFRTGYLFTDFLVKGYKWISTLGFEFRTSAGDISTQRKNFILKHDRPINKFDHVLELDSEPDTGKIRQPFKIVKTFTVQDSYAVYGKNGVTEYYRCSIEERNIDDGLFNEVGAYYSYKGNRSNVEP